MIITNSKEGCQDPHHSLCMLIRHEELICLISSCLAQFVLALPHYRGPILGAPADPSPFSIFQVSSKDKLRGKWYDCCSPTFCHDLRVRTQAQGWIQSKDVYLINKHSNKAERGSPHRTNDQAIKLLSALLNKLTLRTSAAVKVNKHKSLHAGRKTEKAMNIYKNKVTLSCWGGIKQKTHSHKTEAKLILTLTENVNLAFTRHEIFSRNQNTKRSANRRWLWTLTKPKFSPNGRHKARLWNLPLINNLDYG